MDEITERFRAIYHATMKMKGWETQTQYANAIGVKQNTISDWYNGEYGPGRENWAKIEKLYRESTTSVQITGTDGERIAAVDVPVRDEMNPKFRSITWLGNPTMAGEEQFVTAMLQSLIATGAVGKTEREMTEMTNILRGVWRRTFGAD